MRTVSRPPRRPAWLYPFGTILRDARGETWEVRPYCDEYPYRVWERTDAGGSDG